MKSPNAEKMLVFFFFLMKTVQAINISKYAKTDIYRQNIITTFISQTDIHLTTTVGITIYEYGLLHLTVYMKKTL